jgi:hypothetical protein
MDAIESALKCVECKSILDCPVLLPCSDSVCKKHVSQTESAKDFHCLQCDTTHAIPEAGFPHNKGLAILINAKIEKLKFSPQHKSALDSVKSLDKIVNDLNLFHKDPYFLVNKRIGELKSETDIIRDQFKLSIDQKANALIKELDEYEQECKRNLDSNDVGKKLEQIAVKIVAIKDELTKWQNSLNCFDSDEKEWAGIREKSSQIKQELETKLNEYEDEFLLKKLSDYQTKVASFCKIQLKSDRKFDDTHFFLTIDCDFESFLNKFKFIIYRTAIENISTNVPLFNSNILDIDLQKKLNVLCEFSPNQKWQLLYRGSEHGFSADNFRAHCGDHAGTLTVVKSTNGNIFGGYTDQTWAIVKNYEFKADANAFLFSLINKDRQALKMRVKTAEKAIFCCTDYGPTFGHGNCDLIIRNNCHLNASSGTPDFAQTYAHPRYVHGSNEAKSFLAGSTPFQVAEIEVFKRQ